MDQLTRAELEQAEGRIFRSLERAYVSQDRQRTETLSLQLSALCRYIRKRQEGALLVEAAFLLPLFVLILVGALDLGCALINRQVLQGAAFSAALYGVQPVPAGIPRPTLEQVQGEAVARAQGLILADTPSATATATGFSPGDVLTVQVQAPQRWIFLFPSGTVTAVSSVRFQ